jgi:hypothetical protein
MSCRDIHGKLMQFYSLFVSLIIHLPDKECMQPVCRKKTEEVEGHFSFDSFRTSSIYHYSI